MADKKKNLKVTDAKFTDATKLLFPNPEKRQSMQGFEDDYVDIVDYIVRITHRIWEERNLGLIENYYLDKILIHTSDGQTHDRNSVIAASAGVMNAFPDIRLFADDVIWSGNDQDGFHSSHRITWIGRNLGHSIYGPPTGKKVMRQGIAHCFVKENMIVEEWICRDELALVQQLGLDPIETAKAMAAKSATAGKENFAFNTGEIDRLKGQLPTQAYQGDTKHPEGLVRKLFHEVWNRRMVGKLSDFYEASLYARTPGHRMTYGLGDYSSYVFALIAAFPDLSITIDHQCTIEAEKEGQPSRVATRWFMHGTHLGPGAWGDPTGKTISVWGVSHHEIVNWKIQKEWMLFDMFAMLKQIYWPS